MNDLKETVNFRLGRRYKEALARLAAKQEKALSELVREVLMDYLAAEERRAWVEQARRDSSAIAEEAKDPSSPEAEMLRVLEAHLEEFAEEWIWDGTEEEVVEPSPGTSNETG